MPGWHTDLTADSRDGAMQRQEGRDSDAGEKWGHGHNGTGPGERERDRKMASEGQEQERSGRESMAMGGVRQQCIARARQRG